MRRLAFLMAALALVSFFSGCAAYDAPIMPPNALVFTNIRAPLSAETEDSTSVGQRQGKAGASSVLGLFAWGDASLNTAAQNGDLKTINYADYEYLSVLFGVYTSFSVVAHGN